MCHHQVAKLYETDIENYLQNAAINPKSFAYFCDKQCNDIATTIKNYKMSIMHKLDNQPNFSWSHHASNGKMMNDLEEHYLLDIKADVQLVHDKCINYAYTYVNDKQISIPEYNKLAHKIDKRAKQFLHVCLEAYETESDAKYMRPWQWRVLRPAALLHDNRGQKT